MTEFKTKHQALKWCLDHIKPSIVGLDNYNRYRQSIKRYKQDPTSLKSNAIQNLFDLFGIEEVCSYNFDPSRVDFKID